MRTEKRVRGILMAVFGTFSAAFFVFAFFVFYILKPKMVRFEALSRQETALLTGTGFGLLVVLVFFILSLIALIRYVKFSSEVNLRHVILIICTVLALLLVFADVALLSDIAKQHAAMLAQPEWALLLPISGFQLVVILVLTYLHLSGSIQHREVEQIAQDSNTFLVVQYVGLLCSAMGLTASGMGFLFPWALNLLVHVVISSAVLLFPYGLVLAYWLVSSFREHGKVLLDEKQMQNIGRSTFLALGGITFGVILLFGFNINRLEGVVRMLWAPFMVFGSIFLFSLGNLVFS
ncbi:MAG TPA: hypothetical protein PK174_05660, partial [Anaerolineaceae bacterium]|nr:hypothetical protein [Anaerolineaceae bacterium]